MNPNTRFCNYELASEETGIPMATLYALVSQKRIPHYRIGPRHVKFRIDEIRAWLGQKNVSEVPVRKHKSGRGA